MRIAGLMREWNDCPRQGRPHPRDADYGSGAKSQCSGFWYPTLPAAPKVGVRRAVLRFVRQRTGAYRHQWIEQEGDVAKQSRPVFLTATRQSPPASSNCRHRSRKQDSAPRMELCCISRAGPGAPAPRRAPPPRDRSQLGPGSDPRPRPT